MLDLRFYILHGKVAKVAKMNLSLKLYILTNERYRCIPLMWALEEEMENVAKGISSTQ